MSRKFRSGLAAAIAVVVLVPSVRAADAGASQDELAIRALVRRSAEAWQTTGAAKIVEGAISGKGFVSAWPQPGTSGVAAIYGRAEYLAFFDRSATNAPGEHVHDTRSIRIVGPLAYEEWTLLQELRGGDFLLIDGMSVYAKEESGWKLIFTAPTSPDKGPQFKALTEKMMRALMAGRCAESLEASDGLVKLEPFNVDLEMGRGNALRGLGRNDEAMAAFDKAAQSKKPAVRSDALRSKGEILAKQGKRDEAIALFTKAIEISDWAAPRYRRAAAEAAAGDARSAMADLRKAVEMAPAEVKREAANDPAFEKLRDTEEFKNLVK